MRSRVLLQFALATLTSGLLGGAAATPAEAPSLDFEVHEGLNINRFVRAGPVAAHLLLRSGTNPRILIAFPAGNSGVGLWFDQVSDKVSWTLRGQPAAVHESDGKGRALYGISAEATVTARELHVRQAVLSSIRVLRDYQTLATQPATVTANAVIRGQSLVWARDRLDGAAGYRLTVEVTRGWLRDGHILAGPDGNIGLRITGLSGETPLTPLSGPELLQSSAAADPAARNTLTFLAYREKLLAGSWRFDTYFGRDTLLSTRLLMPVLNDTAIEAALASVLARLSDRGEVAHEEDVGERAILDHMQTDGSRSAAPVFDYKMIDSSYLLAPVVAAWLLHDEKVSGRATAFLSAPADGPGERRGTRGAALVDNLRFVLRSASGFAADPDKAHLVSLKAGFAVGDWRDSEDGLGGGRYPYDVNAVLVPAALEATAQLQKSGLLTQYLTADDRALFERAATIASVWRAKAPQLFDVAIPAKAARTSIETYARAQGIDVQPALAALGSEDLRFHAIALDASGAPVSVMHSDEGFALLFEELDVERLDRAVSALMRPFPAGLMTSVGMVVANPAFAPSVQARFSRNAYHGTVVWSWQQALFAAGIERQLLRHDLPSPVRQHLVEAQRILWSAINATRSVKNSELWSWAFSDGQYHVAPFGVAAADADESNAAQLWSTVYLAVRPPTAVSSVATDPGFQLSAELADLPAYFPGYLGNGYLSTLSAPRGTEATRAYMVGYMDYSPGDMSRPASLPGWTEIDFSPGPPGSGHGWLNRAPLNAASFKDYRQTLDVHAATLSTHYRYIDRGLETSVEVTTLVSQAAPHLAATQLMITPDYDGTVQLSFVLTLWAQHAPRFPLAVMTGPEMEEAVAANDLTLQPRAPADPDREALWYPGHTKVQKGDGDTGSLSLWLDGQAEQGLAMGMAAAVALPEGVSTESLTLQRDQYRLALNVRMKVERGHTYTFDKYVAISRSGWGGDATEDLALARQAREHGFAHLLDEHRAAWDKLWQSDIQIDGDARAQEVVHSELYYLLASSTPNTAWPLGACALTPGYANHAFWDSDTWIFPALLLMYPDRARSMVDFRERTLEPAMQRARERGFAGAMYPWESDPENGTEQTPHSAYILGETEIHVNADLAIAQWQYYLATGDVGWLRSHGWNVIREVARFWASRATYNAVKHRYEITHVNSVAESNNDIPNDTFTNIAAATALKIAVTAAHRLGERPDPQWERIARQLYIPISQDGRHHLAFDPGVVGSQEDFGGGPVTLLFLPSLDLKMNPALRHGDYESSIRPTPGDHVARVSMGIAPRTIAADTVGDSVAAAHWFGMNFTGGTLKPPFNVRTETADNNTGYFLTGSGGYLQSLIYGFSGLRIREQGLVEAYPPVLPPGWKSLTLHNFSFRGQRVDIRIARDAAGAVQLTRQTH